MSRFENSVRNVLTFPLDLSKNVRENVGNDSRGNSQKKIMVVTSRSISIYLVFGLSGLLSTCSTNVYVDLLFLHNLVLVAL